MRYRTTIAILLFGVVLLGCQAVERQKTLKLAHGLDINHPVHRGMVFMAERLEEKSGGQLGLEIYPSGQLGSERQCLELLQIGSLSMTKVSASVMENFAPSLKVFSLPYIFRDREHTFSVLDGDIGQELLVQSQDYRLRGLTYFDAGYRSFYTKAAPVNAPADLRGLKIRVQESQTSMNMVRAMGGSPTPISWGELYTALQQGVVDGAENNPPSFYTSRHYEVCKYYVLNEHSAVPDILVVGTDAWNRLTDQERDWLLEAAREATDYQRELWAVAEQEALQAVTEAGVEVIRPDKEPFAQAVEELYQSYEGQPEVYDLIKRIRSVGTGAME